MQSYSLHLHLRSSSNMPGADSSKEIDGLRNIVETYCAVDVGSTGCRVALSHQNNFIDIRKYQGSDGTNVDYPCLGGFRSDGTPVIGFEAALLKTQDGVDVVSCLKSLLQEGAYGDLAREQIFSLASQKKWHEDKVPLHLIKHILADLWKAAKDQCKEAGIPDPEILQMSVPATLGDKGRLALEQAAILAGWPAAATDFKEVLARALYKFYSSELKNNDEDVPQDWKRPIGMTVRYFDIGGNSGVRRYCDTRGVLADNVRSNI